MGKKRQQHRGQQKRRKTQRKWERYWIEDTPSDAANQEGSFVVHITRVNLTDEHPGLPKQPTTETSVEMAGLKRAPVAKSIRPKVGGMLPIGIQRATSASIQAPLKLPYHTHLPHGDCGDGIVNPHPESVDDKYWAQRKRLFGRFDEGIRLDADGWFSVTPEAIANHIAERMVDGAENANLIVLDPFAGVGGNVIALAMRPEVKLVIAVDLDAKRLELAANNCRVYEIPSSKVVFLHANALDVLRACRSNLHGQDASSTKVMHGYQFGGLELLPRQAVDSIFLSPPWGGPDYEEKAGRRGYDLKAITIDAEHDGEDLLLLSAQALLSEDKKIVYFLPRNANGTKIAHNAMKAGLYDGIELEQNYLNGKLKTVTAYFGSLKRSD